MIRVQAILREITPTHKLIETVIDSFLVEDEKAKATMDIVMKRHKNNSHYLYIMQNAETQQLICRTTENKYQL